MVKSISEKTIKQCNKLLNLWWIFFQENEIALYDADTDNVIDFLTKQLNSVKSYSTLNTHRSAILLIYGKHTVGAHPDMIRFFKGIPILQVLSNVGSKHVLKYLSEQGLNEKLGLKGLTKKLVTLLALVTRQRVQTSFCIKVSNIIQEDKRIRFKIEEKLKGHEIDARFRDTLLWCPAEHMSSPNPSHILGKKFRLAALGFLKGAESPISL